MTNTTKARERTISFKVSQAHYDFVRHAVRTILKQLGYKLNDV